MKHRSRDIYCAKDFFYRFESLQPFSRFSIWWEVQQIWALLDITVIAQCFKSLATVFVQALIKFNNKENTYMGITWPWAASSAEIVSMALSHHDFLIALMPAAAHGNPHACFVKWS